MTMRQAVKLFRIKPGERLQAAVVIGIGLLLNALSTLRLHPLFMQPGFGPYAKLFEREFHMGGYDPYAVMTITDWDIIYEVHRHPLLAFLIYPFHLVNEGLTWLFGVNCVQYILAAILTFCTLYSYIFLFRILKEVVCLPHRDATLLTAFHFSFAYILLSVIVPDHFGVSMFLLLLTLYVSGVCIWKGREILWWQSAVIFLVTAGVTLSNGIKVFLAALFVNRRSFFRLRYLLLAVLIPSALLWGVAIWQHYAFVQPREEVQKMEKQRKAEKMKAYVARLTSAERAKFEKQKARRAEVLHRQAAKTGTPVDDSGFLRWTDVTTSRWQAIRDNLFGEAIQFHRQHFMEDVLVHRPVFVSYEWWLSDVVEALVLLLAAMGLWWGRRSRFLWLCLSWFAFDMLIHLLLGFGINEIHIMSPHYLFVLPIATAYLFRRVQTPWLRVGVLLLTLYLFVYNGYLLTDFLLLPIKTVL